MVEFAISPKLRTEISTRLQSFDRVRSTDLTLRRAAVAIVISPASSGDEACVLVTLRPQSLSRHGGQYALPGGRQDADETDIDTARRELHEELGLDLPDAAVLGQLDDFPTRSGFRIAPVVMWSEHSNMTPDPGEVAEVFHLPFSELNRDEIPRLEKSTAGMQPVLSAYFPTLGHYLYAPTAAILYQFREVAIRGQGTRAAHFEQPAFAWT